jgi:succinate dehydrogenase cytochrome b subunit
MGTGNELAVVSIFSYGFAGVSGPVVRSTIVQKGANQVMAGVERPVSPHATIYSWKVTNTLSILHRLTGVMLSVGLLVLVCWLIALASGADAYARVAAFYGAEWFKLPLGVWVFCFFFHLANGIRHLCWDVGFGFGQVQIRAGGWAVVVTAVVATAAFALTVWS